MNTFYNLFIALKFRQTFASQNIFAKIFFTKLLQLVHQLFADFSFILSIEILLNFLKGRIVPEEGVKVVELANKVSKIFECFDMGWEYFVGYLVSSGDNFGWRKIFLFWFLGRFLGFLVGGFIL